MYIIEKLIKIFMGLKSPQVKYKAPLNEDNPDLEDVITCSHNFLPIDSTGRILACSKCGYLITKKQFLKQKNIFMQDNKKQKR